MHHYCYCRNDWTSSSKTCRTEWTAVGRIILLHLDFNAAMFESILGFWDETRVKLYTTTVSGSLRWRHTSDFLSKFEQQHAWSLTFCFLQTRRLFCTEYHSNTTDICTALVRSRCGRIQFVVVIITFNPVQMERKDKTFLWIINGCKWCDVVKTKGRRRGEGEKEAREKSWCTRAIRPTHGSSWN